MLFNSYLGKNKCHKNYPKCHNEDVKHKAGVACYVLNEYPSTLVQLEECVTRAEY